MEIPDKGGLIGFNRVEGANQIAYDRRPTINGVAIEILFGDPDFVEEIGGVVVDHAEIC